tara:strand:+ start:347 stop:1438 length:1092 start_codon:yes stop_codon:yes gene_type:complete
MRLTKFKKLKFQSYKPGKYEIPTMKKTGKIIKLSANESALGASSKVRQILKKNISTSKYPDYTSKLLRKQISKEFQCDVKKIICGSGSDEIIQMLCQLFLTKGDQVIVPEFSFLMYRIYSSISGAKVIFAKENDFRISINNIIKKVNKKTKIVFLANPNNPTGTYLKKNELINLRKKLRKDILLVIDDAYYEYMKDLKYSSGLKIFKNFKNVFILRTFSKIYGLAALRIGWGYGDKKIIDALNLIKPPFNVNEIAQLCAIEALKDKKFINKSIKHNLYWSKKIKKTLEKFGIYSNEISANFLLLNFNHCKLSAINIEKKLEKNGIILREMNTYGINNHLRLTIGNNKENKFFLKAINKIFKNV